MSAVDDLVAFLRARLDEQEAALIAYRDHRTGLTPCVNWIGQDPEDYTEWDSCAEHIRTGNATNYGGSVDYGLAEVEAKRRILKRYEHVRQPSGEPDSAAMGRWGVLMNEYDLRILPMLALPYAGHDDYHEEWRP